MKYPIKLSQSSHCWLQQSVREGILIWTSLLVVVVPLSTARARCSFVEIVSRNDQSPVASKKEEQKRTADLRTLEPGKPIERELAGGEVHSYSLALATGQYARVVIDQRGINVAVTLFGADRKKIIESDTNETGDLDEVSLVASASASYGLEVRAPDKNASKGRYEIQVKELRVATEQDKRRVAADRLVNEGSGLYNQQTADSRRKALEKYQEALALLRSAKSDATDGQVALIFNAIGRTYGELGERQKALDYFTQALPIVKASDNHRGEATTLNNIGEAYLRLGEPQKALDYSSQALMTDRAAGDRRGEAVALNVLGEVHSTLGDKAKALDYYNQSLSILSVIGDRKLEATALDNIGELYIDRGEYQKALDYFNQALVKHRNVNDRSGEAVALSNIGNVYGRLGDYQQELVFYDQAIARQRALGEGAGQAITLNNIAHAYSNLGDKQKALEFYKQSLELRRAANDLRGEAITLNNIGSIYQNLGDDQKALDYYNQSLTISQRTQNRRGQAIAINNIAFTYKKLGDSPKAREYFNQSLAILRDLGNRSEEAQAIYNIARLERDRGNLGEAHSYIEQTLALVESLRTSVASQQLRASFFASVRQYQEFNIDLLMRLHKQRPSEGFDAAALQASENSRARSLLELLKEAHAEIRHGVDPSLIERERQLRQEVADKAERQMRLISAKHTEEQAVAAAKELNALTTAYEQLQAQIRLASPRYSALTQPHPLGLKEIQTEVLDDETLLLEYFLGDEKSLLWAVTPTSIKSFELAKRAEIDEAARRVFEVLTARNQNIPNETPAQRKQRLDQADADYPKVSSTLSQMLLGPVASELKNKRLLIVSDGVLQYVPFAALPEPKADVGIFDPLIAGHEIISLPSASVLPVLRQEAADRQAPSKTIAVLADPVFSSNDSRLVASARRQTPAVDKTSPMADVQRSAAESGLLDFVRLRFSRQEADDITRLADGSMELKALDFAASRAVATNPDIGRYRIVHFATHGLINNQHPELSGVVLSLVDQQGHPQNGFLRLYDIYNLKLTADLVVLSACQTALGKEIKGEGLVGLTRGFMYAGAPRVVASLWQIDDRATAELMRRFYAGMLGQKLRPAAALRAAQASMLKEKRWQAPYYWAAFTLQGEWK